MFVLKLTLSIFDRHFLVPTSVNAEELCINGMSFSRRQSQWANSALVVNVNPEDTHFTPSLTGQDAAYESSNVVHDKISDASSLASGKNIILSARTAASAAQSPLQGIYWQEEMERRAAKMGGGQFVVPVQRVTDFLAATSPVTPADESTSVASSAPAAPASPISSSYRLGVREAPLHELYPPFVTKTIRAALLDFERTMPGFISPGKSHLLVRVLLRPFIFFSNFLRNRCDFARSGDAH